MSFLTVDFETYYDDQYSLTKLTTEEYINDRRFEVIGVSISVDGEAANWFSGSHEEVAKHLSQFDWADSAVLAHNMMFDGAILAWKFGIIPAFYHDTLCMARAIHGTEVGGSLAKLVRHYRLGEKGTEVINAKGKRRADFTPAELRAYSIYCDKDVNLTFRLFNAMQNSTGFRQMEHRLIDLTLRMFIEPVFHVDDALLVERLETMQLERNELLQGLMHVLDVGSGEEVRKKLSSNKQFAQLLTDMGIQPPKKISPTTGKETYALAKTDEGFIELQSHPDPIVQELCAVRLGTKSTIEQSRIERFIGVGARNKGRLPIPLRYYGAHTGRWAGMDLVNFQNLPSRDKKKKALKNSVLAPSGYVVINSDSSQIEARGLAWLAGQMDVVEAFAQGRDVYCEDATKVYGFTVTKANPVERFVGKTMRLGLGYGTGPQKLQWTLKVQPPGADLSELECAHFVSRWREANYKIVAFWRACDAALQDLLDWPTGKKPYPLGRDCLMVCPEGIRLPNGLLIRYPGLRIHEGNFVYDSRKGMTKIWGGAVTENVVQALARIVIGEQMLAISDQYRVGLTVHDSVVAVVREEDREQAMRDMVEIMSTPPAWAPDLPVACEALWGYSYGELQE